MVFNSEVQPSYNPTSPSNNVSDSDDGAPDTEIINLNDLPRKRKIYSKVSNSISASGSGSKIKKTSEPILTDEDFITMLIYIAQTNTIEELTSERMTTLISEYMTNLKNKLSIKEKIQYKGDDEKRIAFYNLPTEEKNKIYTYVMNEMFIEINSFGGSVLGFSREDMKYFLSTYRKFINPVDITFAESARMNNHRHSGMNKKGSLSNQKQNSMPFIYMNKSIEQFVSLLGNKNEHLISLYTNDVALLPIYDMVHKVKFTIPYIKYLNNSLGFVEDTNDASKNNSSSGSNSTALTDKSMIGVENDTPSKFVRLQIQDNKLIYLLITKHIILIHDENSWSVPHGHYGKIIEREISPKIHNLDFLKKSEENYIILECGIYNNKNIRVLDVVQSNQPLPDSYTERKQLIPELSSLLSFATILPKDHVDNYVQKPMMRSSKDGDNNVLMFIKNPYVGALIGMNIKNKTAIMCLKSKDEKSLVHISDVTLLALMNMTNFATQPGKEIKIEDDKEFTVRLDNEDILVTNHTLKDSTIYLFDNVVKYVIKHSKLFIYTSDGSVTNEREAKNVTHKDPQTIEQITTHIDKNLEAVMSVIAGNEVYLKALLEKIGRDEISKKIHDSITE